MQEETKRLQIENGQLRDELKRVKDELEGMRAREATVSKGARWAGRSVFAMVSGARVRSAWRELVRAGSRAAQEHERGFPLEEVADFGFAVVMRVAFVSTVIALLPLGLLLVQTYLLHIQNQRLSAQNRLMATQNEQLLTQSEQLETQTAVSVSSLTGTLRESLTTGTGGAHLAANMTVASPEVLTQPLVNLLADSAVAESSLRALLRALVLAPDSMAPLLAGADAPGARIVGLDRIDLRPLAGSGILRGAVVSGTLRYVRLDGVSLEGSDLYEATFDWANLSGSSLHLAKLPPVDVIRDGWLCLGTEFMDDTVYVGGPRRELEFTQTTPTTRVGEVQVRRQRMTRAELIPQIQGRGPQSFTCDEGVWQQAMNR